MSTRPSRQRFERALFMLALVISGEAIFGLPFHVARFFRPTVLRALELSNTELGTMQAVYGVIAMLAYFPGGPLADRFPARKLMTASLVSTGIGGLYFASMPGFQGMLVLFGFWGVTTILLFWAALIRATREWGGHDEQGRAYGILDGGRGLLAAVVASGAVVLLAWFFPDDAETVSDAQRLEALRNVIFVYTAVTFAAAGFVWFFVPEKTAGPAAPQAHVWRHVPEVLRMPAVWLQALIVVCAYSAFKGLDNYSLFAVEAYGMNEIEGARVSTLAGWVRPFAAVAAGFLADRISSSRVVSISFAILVGGFLFFALDEPDPDAAWILLANVVVTGVAVFGLRGVYFALFEEARVPLAVTGTAVGLVSVIGYTPDVFVGPVGGWLLDRSPGAAGHQHFFFFLAVVAGVGLAASQVFQRLKKPGE